MTDKQWNKYDWQGRTRENIEQSEKQATVACFGIVMVFIMALAIEYIITL